jgi:hypothetical protein
MTKFDHFVLKAAAPLWEISQNVPKRVNRHLIRLISFDDKQLILMLTTWSGDSCGGRTTENLFRGRLPKGVRRHPRISQIIVELPEPVFTLEGNIHCFASETKYYLREDAVILGRALRGL